MPTKSWRKNIPVIDTLTQSAYDYSFQQSVRLLERSAVYDKKLSNAQVATSPVSSFSPPANEAIRFKTHQSLAFPSGEIKSIQKYSSKNHTDKQWQLIINFLGISGVQGVLPYHYSELILKRQKVKDETLEHFLNLFNHRTISLFYKASVKYRLPVQYERNLLHSSSRKKTDQHSQALLSLIGLGTAGLDNRLYTRDESLIYYAGLFNQKIRNTSNLKQILKTHFNIPVQVEQFIGQWKELIDDVRSKLPDFNNPMGRNAQLGRSLMIGKKGWFAQGKIRIILGPLDKAQLDRFAPGTVTLKALNELVRMYVGMENDYEFRIRIYKRDKPERISLSAKTPSIIGWDTWLTSKPGRYTEDETQDISISSSRFR
jgi:type VI secretion system protein ImpH